LGKKKPEGGRRSGSWQIQIMGKRSGPLLGAGPRIEEIIGSKKRKCQKTRFGGERISKGNLSYLPDLTEKLL